MKAVPLLAITNAVTLALVLLLFFQDQPQARQRAAAPQAQVDLEALKSEILADLKQHASDLYRPGVTTETDDRVVMKDGDGKPTNASTGDGSGGPSAEGSDSETPTLSGEPMNLFRTNVRKAIELNREEDRVNREVDRIDRLIADNKIGTLNAKQKKAVATVLLNSREKTPRIWRQFRENPEIRDLPREERAKLIRVEYQKIRDETQKELEDVVPAADAKTILDEGMRGGDRGFRGFGGGGPGTTRRSR